MSDTRRNVTEHPRWHPGFPEFDARFGKDGSDPRHKAYTLKHQTRDRKSHASQRKKNKGFIKGVRNDRPSLLKKVDDLRLREKMEDLR